ncbi:MAG: VCBS repeat-containing protein [Bacteroidetes bacterium]|nr:VCBS repeat-containing protein [Bacteroidota bacterium]
MKKLFSLFIFAFFFSISFSLFAQSDLSVTDLKVPGQISDYVVKDINKDDRADFIVSFISVAGPKTGNRFISTFLQTPDGFYSEPGQTIQIDANVVGFELANVSGDQADELILLQKSGLFFMPFQNGNFRKDLLKPLADVNPALPFPDKNSLLHLPLKVSSTKSEFDDLVIPSENSIIVVSKESQKAKSSETITLTGFPETEMQPEGVSFTGVNYQIEVPAQKYFPFLSENSQDLVLIYKNRISVYFQDPTSGLKPYPDFSLHFLSTGSEEIAIRASDDFNGDGVLDVLLERSLFNDLVSRELKYEFYYGSRNPKGQTQLKNKPDQIISGSGILVQYSMEDLNRDGRLDFVTLEANISVTNLLTSFVTRDMKINYKFYIQKNQRFNSNPSLEKEISQDLNIRKDFNKTLLMTVGADIDGDGFKDLAISKDSKTLMVFSGLQNGIITAAATYFQTVPIPADAKLIRAFPIFEPKRSDLIFIYGAKDPANLRSLVRIISR